MSAGMIRARDSVVALEYTAREGPPGSRRLATGVVINSHGDVLSVRIDRPSSATTTTNSSPGTAGGAASAATTIVAHDASGKRYLAHWVAADIETGLTLLQIAPRAVRPIQIAAEEPILGNQVFVVGNPFGLGHSVSRGHIAGLDRAQAGVTSTRRADSGSGSALPRRQRRGGGQPPRPVARPDP